MLDFFKNRRRRFFIAIAPTVYNRIKEFSKRYNISVKASIQVLLQTNLESWEQGLVDLYGKPVQVPKVSNNPNVAYAPDQRRVTLR